MAADREPLPDAVRAALDEIADALREAGGRTGPFRRLEAIRRGYAAVCRLLKDLGWNWNAFLDALLAHYPARRAAGRPLPIADLVAAHPELALLRDRESLQAFLDPALRLATDAGRLSVDEAQLILRLAQDEFERLVEQPLDSEYFRGRLTQLRQHFCKDPPGGGPPPPPRPPPTRGPGDRETVWLRRLRTAFAALGMLFQAGVFSPADSSPPDSSPAEEEEVQRQLRLLGLLLLALAADLGDVGPREGVRPRQPDGGVRSGDQGQRTPEVVLEAPARVSHPPIGGLIPERATGFSPRWTNGLRS
jgi:hypothetical protein